MRSRIVGYLALVLATTALAPGRAPAQAMSNERFSDWYFCNNAGRLALGRGDLDKASFRFRRAIELARPSAASDPRPLARSYADLALVLLLQNRPADAEPLADWALKVRSRRFGAESEQTAESLHLLSLIAGARNNFPRAEPLLARALAILEKKFGPTSPQLTVYLIDLATIYSQDGKYTMAEPLYRRVLAMSTRDLPTNHPDRVVSFIGLASLHAAQGEFDKAESLDHELIELLERTPASVYPSIAGTLEPYIAQLRKLGRGIEARALENQALATRANNQEVVSPRTRTPGRKKST